MNDICLKVIRDTCFILIVFSWNLPKSIYWTSVSLYTWSWNAL